MESHWEPKFQSRPYAQDKFFLFFFFLREKENIELGREEGGLGQGETGKNDENILYKNVQLKNEYKEY